MEPSGEISFGAVPLCFMQPWILYSAEFTPHINRERIVRLPPGIMCLRMLGSVSIRSKMSKKGNNKNKLTLAVPRRVSPSTRGHNLSGSQRTLNSSMLAQSREQRKLGRKFKTASDWCCTDRHRVCVYVVTRPHFAFHELFFCQLCFCLVTHVLIGEFHVYPVACVSFLNLL